MATLTYLLYLTFYIYQMTFLLVEALVIKVANTARVAYGSLEW